jgi:hypothetical protein
MSSSVALPALPGSSDDPGTGQVEPPLLDELLDDAGSLAAHRDLLTGDHRDVLATLLVPATAEATTALVENLLPGDAGIRVVLAATDLVGLREARSLLLDVDEVELVGVRLTVPHLEDGPELLLDALDVSVPTWITVPPGAAADVVVDALAADGAENAALDLACGAEAAAAVLRRLVDRELSFRASGVDDAVGALAVLAATRAALNGAGTGELATILAARNVAPLVSALRRMSAADAAVTRAFAAAVDVPDATVAVGEFAALDLLSRA